MTDAATHRQNVAAMPDRSTWLSANAGSGKTRVLTNRVARLLLHGVDPQNILCLTYTKAAASEMQNRLFKTLGAWAMLNDSDLRAALSALGETPSGDLSKARTLFASAIEAPGGLKIQTIHSLCSSILRQFPLEAGVNPQFRELDERQQTELIEAILNRMADTHHDVLEEVAKFISEETLADLAISVSKKAEVFHAPRNVPDIFKSFGVSPDLTNDAIAKEALSIVDIAFLKSLVPVLRTSEKTTDTKLADAFDRLSDQVSAQTLMTLENVMLVKSAPFHANVSRLPTKDIKESPEFSPLLPEFVSIMKRVEDARPTRVALAAAHRTVAIHAFAQAFLPTYAAAKKDEGVLDYDDLILQTRALLTKRSMQWVMYRLDGKIDHILVDEAQDTSPAQWDVIEALADEMASGEGERIRTLFVVGDKKQSIYSFQGADAAGFDRRAKSFRDRLADGQGLRSEELAFSFRSSPAVLSAVDHVFQGQDGFDAHHQAYHGDMPGRVDLWPLIKPPDARKDPDWYETGDRVVDNTTSQKLAEAVAARIDDLIGKETIPGENGPRLVKPDDIMVLVQRRNELFDELIQACKRKGLDVAGADRFKIASELAVKDLLALMSFLALPDDSLSLAAALRSPLFGLSEQDLFTLAARRDAKLPLWAALRHQKDAFQHVYDTLSKLLDSVDYQRPFELLERILTRYEGRVRLMERLGPEAEDGINELLNQALIYERNDVPSLTGFLNTVSAADIEIKRQSDNTGGLIRVMTVHAAKGLESPIVILPDTMRSDPQVKSDLLDADGLVVPPVRDGDAPPLIAGAKDQKKAADREERKRLLYVAMTRAEKWLIVCGLQPAKNVGKESWHTLVSEGLERAGAEVLETDVGPGQRLTWGDWPKGPDSAVSETFPDPIPSPREYGNAPAAPAKRKVIAPSDLGGAKVIGGGELREEDALKKGRQIHLLLEHIPNSTNPNALAHRLLGFGADAAQLADIPDLLTEAEQTIAAHPELFAPEALAEVDIVGDVEVLGARMSGTIDRLLISDERVLAVDFKTNTIVPDTPEQTPEGLLRQMGAYLAALEQIYPDRQIDVAILWTATQKLMMLEHGIVREALQRTPTS